MSKPNYQFIIPLTMAASLVACGGSSSSDSSDTGTPDNQAPVAADISVTFDRADADWQQPINVLDSASDPDGDELTITAVGDAQFGTSSIDGDVVVYEPEDGFVGIDTFTYTVSDGQAEAQATVEVNMVSTVAFRGRVIDAPIANATVTMSFGDEVFTTEADDEGFYELPVVIRTLESDEVVRITARGNEANGQAHVTLSSLTTSAGRLLELAGDNFEVSRSDSNDVQVTHVSTARDILVRSAAGDEPLTASNVTDYGNTVDPQLMLEMAAVAKLIIDDEDFDLPEGYDDIESFLNDSESYNAFVEAASQGGENSPLNQAIEETVNDPEVMPEFDVTQLYGRYLEVIRAPAFMKPDADMTWEFSEDGLAWFRYSENYTDHITFSVDGNSLTADVQNEALVRNISFPSVGIGAFDGRPEALDAWRAYNGWGPNEFHNIQVERAFGYGLNSLEVVTFGDDEVILRYDGFHISGAVEFEYQDEVYYVYEESTSVSVLNARLIRESVFKQSDLTFNFSEQPTWLLPRTNTQYSLLEATIYDFTPDNTYSVRQGDMYVEAGMLDESELSGTWELSDDDRVLILTPGNGTEQLRITRHRADSVLMAN